MKSLRSWILVALAALGGLFLSSQVMAHGGWGGPRVGVYLGYGGPGYWGPYWGPRYYGYGYGYPLVVPAPVYPPVVIQSQPPVYVERDALAAPEEQGWWYWCRSSNAYYPYVKSCAEGWQKVPPQPAN